MLAKYIAVSGAESSYYQLSIFHYSFRFVQLLDESALVQLGDEARIHKLLRLAPADLRPSLRNILVGCFESFHDWIRHRNEILLVSVVGIFQGLSVGDLQLFAQNPYGKFLVVAEVSDRFDVRLDHAHHRVAVFDDVLAPSHDGHR